MELDPVLLARLQFAFTITFHIIFPTFTIGLSAFIATLLVMWLADGRRALSPRWPGSGRKIFAVSFAMGVVSGIVLSYQFGTNWSRFSRRRRQCRRAADRLRGAHRLLPRGDLPRHPAVRLEPGAAAGCTCSSAILVAVGTAISAFWILSANSWMQTPAGHEIRDGIAYPVDWLAIVFNPTFPYRLAHMVTAAYLTTAFVVLAVGARHLLAGTHRRRRRAPCCGWGSGMAGGPRAAAAPHRRPARARHARAPAGQARRDRGALGRQRSRAPLVLFAWPDEKAERTATRSRSRTAAA